MIAVDSSLMLSQFRLKTAISTEHCAVKILGIRGWFSEEGDSPENDLGIYDDLIVRIIGDQAAAFRGSTDPGWYYINHPMNPKGCAQLQRGLWWYQTGMHHGHPALVQADAVMVNRLDQTGKIIGRELGWWGLNIHSGGAEYQVGRFSAGCQIIQSPFDAWGPVWHDFYDVVPVALDEAKQRRIPYLLLDRTMFY